MKKSSFTACVTESSVIFFSQPPWQQQHTELEAITTQSQSTQRLNGMHAISVQWEGMVGVVVGVVVDWSVGVGVAATAVGESYRKFQRAVGVG